MKKRYGVTIIAGGLILFAALAASLTYADEGAKVTFPGGFPHWTMAVPDGVSFSVGNGERTHPLRVFRDQSGKLARGTENQLASGNWSGYVLAKYETGKTYTSAAGTWIVPSAAVPTGQSVGYSSAWVGIGGFCENANCTRGDGTLIQLGTESDANGSGANYYAWYEMLPQSETLIPGFVVHSGDRVTASLALLPGSQNQNRFSRFLQRQTWKLTITNVTTGATWTKNVNYQSSELSADWVQEAPSSYSGILPLANYGTATFDPETVNNGTNPSFTTANEVIMLNPNGQTSNPSTPDTDTDGFNACWGNGTTLTACSAPIS